MLAGSISQVFGAGWPGGFVQGRTWLTGVSCRVIRVTLIAVGQSALCLYSRPAPPSCLGKYVVRMDVSTDLSV